MLKRLLIVLFVPFLLGAESPSVPPATLTPEEAVEAMKNLGGKFLTKGHRASWSPDSARFVFGHNPKDPRNALGGGIAVFDVRTGKTTDLTDVGKDPAWSGKDGKWVAYVIGRATQEEIWLVDAEGKDRRKVADGGFPSWAAGGKTLFYRAGPGERLMAVEIREGESSDAKVIAPIPSFYPAVSRDGKQVAYRYGGDVIAVVGDAQKRFPCRTGYGFLGGWSPDGKKLAYGGYGGSDGVPLVVLDVETGENVQVASQFFTLPAWSPDGRWLAFDFRASADFEIWMLDTQVLSKLPKTVQQPDPFAIPQGDVAELARFIDYLRTWPITPGMSQSDQYFVRGRPALLAAANRMLQLETAENSVPYQTALLVLLDERLRRFGSSNPEQQAEMIELIRMFLAANPDLALTRDAVRLAMNVARELESHQPQQAIDVYQSFAKLIAQRNDERLSQEARRMEGAIRRLGLVGKQIEVEGNRFDGQPINWPAFRGKTVLLFFWTASQPACGPELANAMKNQKRYGNRGFEVIGICLDEDRRQVEQFAQEQAPAWTVLHKTGAGWNHPMAIAYGVSGVPAMLLVGSDGKVVSIQARGQELDRMLEELLGEATTPQR